MITHIQKLDTLIPLRDVKVLLVDISSMFMFVLISLYVTVTSYYDPVYTVCIDL